MTRNAFLSFLGDSSTQDGIYNSNGRIYLKANAINTGALQIGTGSNELFYANVGNPAVRIAGWEVTSTGF
jgi:hypothetical protein